MRLDLFLSQKLGVSRNRAQFFISQGKVSINKKVITKSSFLLGKDDIVEENIEEINYVSRSALKLKGFLEENNLEVNDFICVDVGASTGGFTQILIERGVKRVYAIDVGTAQLHEKLKNNEKIVSIENTDIRKFDKNLIKEEINLVVCDVSFISLSLIIDAILDLMNNQTLALLLFKPQFEVGNENLTKLGVPKDIKISQEKMSNFLLLLQKKGVEILLIKNSILKGENGNKEIFILIKKVCQYH